MMSRPKQAAAVLIAGGKSHLTKAEKAMRLETDAVARSPKGEDAGRFHPPGWLPKDLRAEYNELRTQLTGLGLISKMDRDILGFYLVARTEYVHAGKRASAAIRAGDDEGARSWGSVQDKYFKQARGCAGDLGLTITSRCRLVLPPKLEDDVDEFTQFLQRRNRAAGSE